MNLVSHNSALRCSYWLALALARRGLYEGGGIGVGVGVGLQNWRWRWRRAPELAERFKDIKKQASGLQSSGVHPSQVHLAKGKQAHPSLTRRMNGRWNLMLIPTSWMSSKRTKFDSKFDARP